MRTLVSSLAAVVAVSFFACGTPSGGTGGGAGGGTGGGSVGGGSGGGSVGGGTGGGSVGGGSGGGTGGGSVGGGGGGSGGGAGGGTGGGGGVPITITFSASCPNFTPCGGDVVANWAYTSVCVDSADPFPAVSQACPGASFSNLAGTTQGGLYFDATTVHRNVNTHITGDLTVSGTCAVAGCAAVQSALANTFTSVTCTGTTSCSCSFVYDRLVANQTAGYVVSGSRLTTDPGTSAERQYDYCVNGSMLGYHEVTSAPADPGVATLTQM